MGKVFYKYTAQGGPLFVLMKPRSDAEVLGIGVLTFILNAQFIVVGRLSDWICESVSTLLRRVRGAT